jgi:hypothetical protein
MEGIWKPESEVKNRKEVMWDPESEVKKIGGRDVRTQIGSKKQKEKMWKLKSEVKKQKEGT